MGVPAQERTDHEVLDKISDAEFEPQRKLHQFRRMEQTIHFLFPQAAENLRHQSNPPRPGLLQQSRSPGCCRHPYAARILPVGFNSRQPRTLQSRDNAAHRRGLYLLGSRQLPQRHRPAEYQDRKRRQPRWTDAG